MRQVPRYLLIGNGRLARHLRVYFAEMQLPFQTWQRGQDLLLLRAYLREASHVLLLISDQAIEPFIEAYLRESPAILIHCSGSLVSSKAFGVHPLMSFASTTYPLDFYKKIPFVIDEGGPAFAELLPGLPNPHAYLNAALKPKYHALCVLAANFSCMLWQKLLRDFKGGLGLPQDLAQPFLWRQMMNLLEAPEQALTGPLVRQDHLTIQNNLAALEGDAFQKIYQQFVEVYQREYL